MNLLLLSLGPGAVPAFLKETAPEHPRIGYLGAAGVGMPFAAEERARIEALGHPVIDVGDQLPEIDVLYVAGGNIFVLVDHLRRTGLDRVITDRVRAGLPYIGLSAGSVVTGPSIEAISLMDDPSEAPELTDLTGLGLISDVVLPHADGQLPPYPPELIARTVAQYGSAHRLLLLRDDQALRVDDGGQRVIPSR
ncbi:Type 1 glutamine amidotransferase-like domain-containing protein [Cellulomonas sp. NPDC089187]|uniref:Type 1 glutamine amidotransferase-like domain-containing protein n=1 Tax=Cellulomonas sp. NPDC089187 TaxID=3154970 RepID=UPI0034307B9A